MLGRWTIWFAVPFRALVDAGVHGDGLAAHGGDDGRGPPVAHYDSCPSVGEFRGLGDRGQVQDMPPVCSGSIAVAARSNSRFEGSLKVTPPAPALGRVFTGSLMQWDHV